MSNFTMNTSKMSDNDNDGWKTVGGERKSAWTGAGAGGSGSRSWGGGWGSSSTAFGSGSGSGSGGGREMPAAFGGDPRKAERRAAAEAQAAREAIEAREKRAAEEKERKRIADATNFTSEEFYPSLGGGGGVSTKPKPAMNFSKVVSEMAEREEIRRIEEEREAAAAAAAAAQARSDATVARRHVYGYRSVQHFTYAGDDADEEAPADDYPEDSDYEEEPPAAEEEDTGEFNADIGSSRRRGDKGIW